MTATYGDIIFFAIVALFLGIKLFSVLGRKESDEDIRKIITKHEQASAGKLADLAAQANKKPALLKPVASNDQEKQEEVIDEISYSDEIKAILQNIKKADTSFEVNNFVYGAKAAFEMVMKAFSENDKNTLKMLLVPHIYDVLERKIDSNISSAITEQKSIVAIDAKEITAAQFANNVVKLRLNFMSEQINIVKDANGNVISGGATKIEVVEDSWEFERNIKSPNPNWLITAIS